MNSMETWTLVFGLAVWAMFIHWIRNAMAENIASLTFRSCAKFRSAGEAGTQADRWRGRVVPFAVLAMVSDLIGFTVVLAILISRLFGGLGPAHNLQMSLLAVIALFMMGTGFEIMDKAARNLADRFSTEKKRIEELADGVQRRGYGSDPTALPADQQWSGEQEG